MRRFLLRCVGGCLVAVQCAPALAALPRPLDWSWVGVVAAQIQQRSAPRRRGQIVRPAPQDAEKEAAGITDPDLVKTFWQRVDQWEADCQRRQLRLPALASGDGRVVALVDKAVVGLLAEETGQKRYLALHLVIGNSTKTPLTLAREGIAAAIDGAQRPVEEIKSRLLPMSFTYAGEQYHLQNLQTPTEVKLPAEGYGGTWLVYSGLPMGQIVPECRLKLRLGDRVLDLDVNQCQRGLLDMESERLGPRGCLVLLTLGGLLNTFNVQSLVDELDAAAEQKRVRAVIRWKSGAPQPDSQLLSWLQNAAQQAGSGRTISEQLPPINSSLRELHLVQFPSGGFTPQDFTPTPLAPPKVHATDAEAVAAALRSAFLTMPRDELRAQIAHGHPLVRAAALTHGSARLESTDLPRILEFAQDADGVIRLAALQALGDFGDEPAVARLLETVRRGADAEFATAVNALAESRFSAPREALAQLIEDAEPALRRRVLAVLADRPRSDWAETLLRYVDDERGRLQLPILRALVQLDHPRLPELLERGLKSEDRTLRDFVFPILARRSDERSERAATEYVLAALNQGAPDGLMMEFLGRTKDARAVPALLRQLDRADDRTALINLLGQIGDAQTADAIVSRFPMLPSNEKVAALNALRLLRHSRYLELAGDALAGGEAALLSAATQGLMMDGSPAACRQLVRGLEKQTQPYALSTICNALSAIGTPEARLALLKERGSKEPSRRNAALIGLQNLRTRSPGYQFFAQAQQLLQMQQQQRAPDRTKGWKEAIELFTLAIQLDPQFSDAFIGRADAHLKQEHWVEAGKDFEQGYQLDPYNGMACSGLAIATVMQGRIDAGIEIAEKARERFAGDVNYFYNVACVYGRVVETLQKAPQSPDAAARLQKYRQQAVADLKEAVKLKFDDFAWMREDPDLKSLHNLPEFQQLAREPEEKPPE